MPTRAYAAAASAACTSFSANHDIQATPQGGRSAFTQVFCIFLFLFSASLFGTVITEVSDYAVARRARLNAQA